ncbi:MAG TPA: phosphonate ABC transporter, permease protein PhnE [Usitatibacter sp.]|nr:phosphonate ABC transporter, permease protein PhnE [Usitatibacter sp.]
MDALARRVASRGVRVSGFRGRLAWLLAAYGGHLLAAGVAAYVLYAASTLGFTPERFVRGLEHGHRFLARLFPPDFATRWEDIQHDMLESLEIAVVASIVGIALSLPLGLLAARNLMPPWISWPARFVISVARSFHPVIVGILFVKAIGFGALAGVLTLVVASVGFIGKLFAEAIEEISLKPVEAARAAGAPFTSVLVFGVLPQVVPRFVGFGMYQFDSNLRNSTILGIVGAGGIGGTLLPAFQRFDYPIVCAIVIVMIATIMAGELLTEQVRKVFQ